LWTDAYEKAASLIFNIRNLLVFLRLPHIKAATENVSTKNAKCQVDKMYKYGK